jgi:pilus assembly protein CpaD
MSLSDPPMPTVCTRWVGMAICALALIGLSACATNAPAGFQKAAVTPTEHYAAHVEETPDQMALGVHPDGLSPTQREALADFVARWREAGSGTVVLKAPADGPNADTARAMLYAVQSHLQTLGVPAERIRLAAYPASDPHAPVLASFLHATVVVPDCSGGWDNLTSTNSNEPYSHFGCAVTADIAAQLADPRDLATPPGLAAGDNTRREVVLGKYREGKTTASEKDDQASGAVSSVAKQ